MYLTSGKYFILRDWGVVGPVIRICVYTISFALQMSGIVPCLLVEFFVHSPVHSEYCINANPDR